MKKIYFNRLIKASISGIKCDHCDFRDGTVKWLEHYEAWLNKPCPKCHNNLLTPEDLNSIRVVMFIEKWFGWIRIPSFQPPIRFKVNMNGTGKMEVEKLDIAH